MRRMGRWSSVVLVAAVALGATACSSGGAGDTTTPDPSTSPSASASAAASAAPLTPPPTFTGVEHKLPEGKRLRNDPDLYETVALEACTKVEGGGWRAEGSATNATDEDLDYSILVFFTDAQARIVDFARAEVEATAGGTAQWTATKTFRTPGKVNCVVRAVTAAS